MAVIENVIGVKKGRLMVATVVIAVVLMLVYVSLNLDVVSSINVLEPLAETITTQAPEDVIAALYTLGARLHQQGPDSVRLVSWEEAVWPDGCLDVPMRAPCAPEETPGYRIAVTISGTRYEYHSTSLAAQPYRLLLAQGPGHGIDEPALIWEQQDNQACHSLLLAKDGRAAIGPCDAPHTALRLVNSQFARPDLWSYWLDRFSSFEAELPLGGIVFRGQGQEAASPAWRRALGAWSQLVWAELQSGRSGASWGAALRLEQEMAETPGGCGTLYVERYGLARASYGPCDGGEAVIVSEGWLETTEWEEFDAWYYSRTQFVRPGLEFYGNGAADMQASEIETLERWADAVFSRLVAQLDVSGPGYAREISVKGDLVFVGAADGGFLVLRDVEERSSSLF